MVFPYYQRLSRRQQSIYRSSDRVTRVQLHAPQALHDAVAAMQVALQAEDRREAQRQCRRLADGITADLRLPSVQVRVLEVRPCRRDTELHGLYEPADGDTPACISLWMRTVRHKRVVAFRTFLRTLLHELCHHLDYELLQLPDSLHTEGFFKRESSLFQQLVAEAAPPGTRRMAGGG